MAVDGQKQGDLRQRMASTANFGQWTGGRTRHHPMRPVALRAAPNLGPTSAVSPTLSVLEGVRHAVLTQQFHRLESALRANINCAITFLSLEGPCEGYRSCK